MPRGRGGARAAEAAIRAAMQRSDARKPDYVPFRGRPHPEKPGRYLIRHPSEAMTPEERAFEMWAVHPGDLDGFDMTREMFFHAHLTAAMAAAAAAAGPPPSGGG